MKKWFPHPHWFPLLFIGMLLVARTAPRWPALLAQNKTAVAINRAIAHPNLPLTHRTQLLDHPSAALELAHLQQAAAYLQQHSLYHNFEPGPQLLYNPDFMHDLTGWTQYNAAWQTAPTAVANDPHVLTYGRQGEGHGSLSQTLALHHGRCYLFMLTGAVDRQDSTPTLWFYLESYDAHNQPHGQTLQRADGSQPWQTRFAPFCLTDNQLNPDKITVAPVNLYGDATVQLGSARLYQLNPKAIP